MPTWYVYEAKYPKEGSTAIEAETAVDAIRHFEHLTGCDGDEFAASLEPREPVVPID